MVRQLIATYAANRLNTRGGRPIDLAGLILLAAVTFAPRVDASITVFESNGFEDAAGYKTAYLGTGQLEGQPVGPPHWQVPGATTSTAVVQTTTVESGTQAVRVDRNPGDPGPPPVSGDQRWGVPVSGYPTLNGTPYPLFPSDTIAVTWDMLVSPATGGPFGPFFGIQSYGDPSGSGSLLGSFGADASTGEVLVQYPLGASFPDGGGIQPVDISGATYNLNGWNTYQMLLDFSTKTYDVLLNGTLLPAGPIPFLDGAFTTFSDADIAALLLNRSGTTDPNDIPGTAYFDDFSVTEQTVPEPNSLVVWGTVVLLSLIGVRVRTAAKRNFPDLNRC